MQVPQISTAVKTTTRCNSRTAKMEKSTGAKEKKKRGKEDLSDNEFVALPYRMSPWSCT